MSEPEDHDARLEAKLRSWLQAWIDDNIKQFDYPTVPEYLFSKWHTREMARLSVLREWKEICRFLQDKPGFEVMGKDSIEKFAAFLAEEKREAIIEDWQAIRTKTPRKEGLFPGVALVVGAASGTSMCLRKKSSHAHI